ncbi:MAG: uroporphyrinogen-III C-methyltransferase [Epsilonproteobacteria bacterium]|nr:MAG: uroporphyrinogen-III C-methyltransferase [Campylobacterota bacterium]
MKHSTLPILLKNQKILLIGGGNVALQKAEVLSHNNIDFRIVAEELNKKIVKLTDKIKQKRFKLKDIKNEEIIIDATGNPKVARKLLKYKKKHPILLNVVDVPELCDFYFMALTKNRPLQIAVSSNGASPTAAKYFRDECERLIPEDITAYLNQKQQLRDAGIIDVAQTQKELVSQQTKVFLVGCGIGDPELLTLKALKTIQSADVILYDHLISDEIMQLIPKSTKKIYVGKQKGYHSKSQEKINALIIKHAKKGRVVARLKSGDPFVFGRGAEELKDLFSEDINTEVIPGISSSIAGPLMGNIPITARGYASGFTVVSAHLQGNSINLDWVELLEKENHTVVVLMGLSRVNEIVEEAARLGVSKKKPCAIISNASRPNQKIVTTTLEQLVSDAKDIARPAILVFGDVVKYRSLLGEQDA